MACACSWSQGVLVWKRVALLLNLRGRWAWALGRPLPPLPLPASLASRSCRRSASLLSSSRKGPRPPASSSAFARALASHSCRRSASLLSSSRKGPRPARFLLCLCPCPCLTQLSALCFFAVFLPAIGPRPPASSSAFARALASRSCRRSASLLSSSRKGPRAACFLICLCPRPFLMQLSALCLSAVLFAQGSTTARSLRCPLLLPSNFLCALLGQALLFFGLAALRIAAPSLSSAAPCPEAAPMTRRPWQRILNPQLSILHLGAVSETLQAGSVKQLEKPCSSTYKAVLPFARCSVSFSWHTLELCRLVLLRHNVLTWVALRACGFL